MKRSVWVGLYLVLAAGCAHLEVPRDGVYPFRARFEASGVVGGTGVDIQGALVLTSARTGTVQVYGPGGLPVGTVIIRNADLTFTDMWGRKTGEATMPLPDIAGIVAGDLPEGPYLLRTTADGHARVFYAWGWLGVDEARMPRELHAWGTSGLDVTVDTSTADVRLEVKYGDDTLTILLEEIEGGRWATQ